MIKVKFIGMKRGFFQYIIENPPPNIEFVGKSNGYFEVSSKLKKFLRYLFVSKLGDYLGLILSLKSKNAECDIVQSYNRFIRSDKNYLIILENPTALHHYSLNRCKTFLGKKRINSLLKDKNLRGIVCLSKACEETLSELIPIKDQLLIRQVYPCVRINSQVDENKFLCVIHKKNIKCLFVSSQFELKSGKELVKVFEHLKNVNVELEIITKIESISEEYLNKINENKNIKLTEFNLTYGELEKKYAESDILLHATRQDSLPLVVIEAIKAGMIVIGCDLYAIKEVVKDSYNGYLIRAKYLFFDENNMPNPAVWNNRTETIYSDYEDQQIVDFLLEKILFLNNNREKLSEMMINSFETSKNKEFSEDMIKRKWELIYKEILQEK